MRKIGVFILFMAASLVGYSQDSAKASQLKQLTAQLKNRANDHFMIQYGADFWNVNADSARPSGFSRHFNFYFMLDKPFKKNPHFSLGYGLGLTTSNMFFDDKQIDLKANTARLPFTNVANTNHFEKYKLTTIFAEIPLELRYASNPLRPDKGFKAAIGVKIGTILKAYTKGKNLVDANDRSVFGNRYIQKEQDRKFINGTSFSLTARAGVGIFSLHASYRLNTFLREGVGPDIRPYSIGLMISGL